MTLHATWIELKMNSNFLIEFKNIESNSSFIEFKFNWIQSKFLNQTQIYWIKFKFHWRGTKCKLVHKVLKICSSLPSFVIWCWKIKKTLKKHIWKKTFLFHSKQILIWKNYFDKTRWLMDPINSLPYYHCHHVTILIRILFTI
jgi:hypothetical protein